MPYKSAAQRRFFHTKVGLKALGGKAKVAEWDRESAGLHLPERKKRSVRKRTANKML